MARKRSKHTLRGVRIRYIDRNGRRKWSECIPLTRAAIQRETDGILIPDAFDSMHQHEKLNMLAKMGFRHQTVYA